MKIQTQFTSPVRRVDLPSLNPITPSLGPDLPKLTGTTANSIMQILGISNPSALAYVKMAIDNPDKAAAITQKALDRSLAPVREIVRGVANMVNSPNKLRIQVNKLATTFLSTFGATKTGKLAKKSYNSILRAEDAISHSQPLMLLALGNSIVASVQQRDPAFAAASILALGAGESKGNPFATNPNSSAFGLLGITQPTWSFTLGSSGYKNVNDILDKSGFSRVVSTKLGVAKHVLTKPHSSIAKLEHYAEQFPIAIACYNNTLNHVLARFKFEKGQWIPMNGTILPSQWERFKKLTTHLNSYFLGLQSLISAMHINGVNVFDKAGSFSHIARYNADALTMSYLLVDPVFRSAYAALINNFFSGKLERVSTGDLNHNPYSGVEMFSGYNKKRTLKVKGETSTHIHKGVDIKAAGGTPLYAPFCGNVVKSEFSDSAGYLIKLVSDVDGGAIVLFHLQKKGHDLGPVDEGDLLGFVGTTGLSQAPHIHLEYYTKEGRRIDPGLAPYEYVKLVKRKETEWARK